MFSNIIENILCKNVEVSNIAINNETASIYNNVYKQLVWLSLYFYVKYHIANRNFYLIIAF